MTERASPCTCAVFLFPSLKPPHPPTPLYPRPNGPHSMQRLRQYQGSEAKRARTQQLKELEVFKRADAGSDVTNTSVLMFVTTESTMWAASNDIHANRLKEATELWDKALQRKLTWAYLMAPIYAPEDRQTYFESLVEMTFGHTVMTKTEIFKMYDIDGTTKLCLNTAKSMLLGPNRMGLIFKVESKCGDRRRGRRRGKGGKGVSRVSLTSSCLLKRCFCPFASNRTALVLSHPIHADCSLSLLFYPLSLYPSFSISPSRTPF